MSPQIGHVDNPAANQHQQKRVGVVKDPATNQHQQKKTGHVTTKSQQNQHPKSKKGHVTTPAVGLKFVRFTGNWQGHQQSFAVAPAPDAGPLVTGGFPIINVIPRPQRVSLTVPAGYDPVTIDIPIQFEAWATDDNSDAQSIEEDIARLEWMYGRGNFGGGSKGGAVGVGPPPIVTVSTVNASGRIIPLLSSNYQFMTTKGSTINAAALNNGGAPTWEITSVNWDANPLRVPAGQPYGGCRLRQLATVSIQQIESEPYVTTPGTGNVASSAVGKSTKVVTKAGDTLLSIARVQVPGSDAKRASAVATAIMKSNAGNSKMLRSLTKAQPANITLTVTALDKQAT